MKQSCLEILLLYYRHFVKKVKSRYNNTVIAPYLQVLFNSGFCRFAGGSPVFLAVWARPGEREVAFLNVKLYVARFQVCVGLLADRRIMEVTFW